MTMTTGMNLHRFGRGPNAKTVLLPSSGSWLEDAQAQTRARKQSERRAREYREDQARRRQREREEADAIRRRLDADEKVEIPKMLLDALLDHYHYEYWAVPDASNDIVGAYLGKDRE